MIHFLYVDRWYILTLSLINKFPRSKKKIKFYKYRFPIFYFILFYRNFLSFYFNLICLLRICQSFFFLNYNKSVFYSLLFFFFEKINLKLNNKDSCEINEKWTTTKIKITIPNQCYRIITKESRGDISLPKTALVNIIAWRHASPSHVKRN